MALRWRTIDEVLTRSGGELRTLAPLRVALVTTLVVFQSAEVSQSFALVFGTPLWIVPTLAIEGLFALVGVTLAQCREQAMPKPWLIRRATNAWPPVAAATLLAVLAIGPLASVLSLQDYLGDPATTLYLLNLLGLPRFRLPGVFEFNELSAAVNSLMWTVPIYVVVAALIGLAPEKRPRMAMAFGAGATLVAIVAGELLGAGAPAGNDLLSYAGAMTGSFTAALVGAAAHWFRGVIPFDGRLALVAAGTTIAIAFVGDVSWARSVLATILIAPPTAYVAVWLALGRHRSRTAWNAFQPYLAYALFGALPIQQAMVALGPRDQNVLENLALSFPAVVAFAAAARIAMRYCLPRALRTTRSTDAWPVAQPGSRSVSLGDQLRSATAGFAIGLILIGLALGVLALTYFAMQREPTGL